MKAPEAIAELLTDLRRAAGFIGAAIDVLKKRQSEITQLINDAGLPF